MQTERTKEQHVSKGSEFSAKKLCVTYFKKISYHLISQPVCAATDRFFKIKYLKQKKESDLRLRVLLEYL